MARRRQQRDSYTNAPSVELAERPAPGQPGLERGVHPALLATQVADPFAEFARGTPSTSIRCDACAHRCIVREGRRGICGVRENRGGKLVSLVYGEAVTAHPEAIEKKPYFHAFAGSMAYSLATEGCNLHCRYCQNWEISQAPREGLRPQTRWLAPEVAVEEALATGCRSIAYTYVEPTVFLEYALDTARLARTAGLANVVVTNGYQTPEALELMAPLLDAANVDLKAFDDRFYRRISGARLEPVKETLVAMHRAGIWVEVTTLLIPGQNDDPSELERAAAWIAAELGPETPWHLSRFFPAYWLSDLGPTPLATLRAAAEIARMAGLRHVYVGNAGGDDQTDTYCASCGRRLVRRFGYRILANDVRDGCCPDCGARLAGIGWEEA